MDVFSTRSMESSAPTFTVPAELFSDRSGALECILGIELRVVHGLLNGWSPLLPGMLVLIAQQPSPEAMILSSPTTHSSPHLQIVASEELHFSS